MCVCHDLGLRQPLLCSLAVETCAAHDEAGHASMKRRAQYSRNAMLHDKHDPCECSATQCYSTCSCHVVLFDARCVAHDKRISHHMAAISARR